METFYELSQSITGHIPAVLEQFELVTRQEPWIHLPEDYRTNYLGEVISMATTLALLRPMDRELCGKLLHRAAEHGLNRLEKGFPDSLLFKEFYLVRESIWTYLRQQSPEDSAMASEAIIRIDMALSLAAKASLRGYFRSAFERRGTWPQVIDGLVSEWTPPPPIDPIVAVPQGAA